MKITGTPAADFVVKLQSQDVSCCKDRLDTRSNFTCINTSFCYLFKQAKNYIRSLPKVPKKDLHCIFTKASSNGRWKSSRYAAAASAEPPSHRLWNVFLPPAAVCVLEKMLLLDPEQRVSASEALDLPFFSEYRDAEEETEALPYDQTMDNTDLPLDQWKRKN